MKKMERNLGSNTGSCCYIFVWGGGGGIWNHKTYVKKRTWTANTPGVTYMKEKVPKNLEILQFSPSSWNLVLGFLHEIRSGNILSSQKNLPHNSGPSIFLNLDLYKCILRDTALTITHRYGGNSHQLHFPRPTCSSLCNVRLHGDRLTRGQLDCWS